MTSFNEWGSIYTVSAPERVARAEQLHRLLLSLFASADSFRQWVSLGPDGVSLVADLPGGTASASEVIFGGITVLGRRGHLATTFFARLIADFPRRRDEIIRVARTGSDQFDAGPISGTPPARVLLGRLPTCGELLVGRTTELEKLHAAWSDGPTRRHVLTVVAWGGTGKTALISRWLANLAAEGYLGARRVLGWSFFSQGACEDRVVSADEFVAWALEELGDLCPTAGTPFHKAERLAKLVRQERTLLVLDGIEPLQYPPGPDEGKLRDHALANFLRELCASNPGLCVITSRLRLADLAPYFGNTVEHMDLSQLNAEDGATLLDSLGVRGTQQELREAATDFGGHALALTLLGRYLMDACGGDVRRRDEIGPLVYEETRGGHARRVMSTYEQWFSGGTEREILRVLSLFDRPASHAALGALRAAPAIPELTEHLTEIDNRSWNLALSRLRRAGIVASAARNTPADVEVHPLVREHFSEVLRRNSLPAWREGHSRLFAHYQAAATLLPTTLTEMSPLYAAAMHGCKAAQYHDAFRLVWRRIYREEEFFAVRRLGAISAVLTVLAGFFDLHWSRPVLALNEMECAWLFNEAGCSLGALGRLYEGSEALRRALMAHVALGAWDEAANTAANLSQMLLPLGEVESSICFGNQAVEFALRCGDADVQCYCHAVLADALHQAGRIEDSERAFVDAEGFRSDLYDHKHRDSLASCMRYDLLLTRDASEEVIRRGTETLRHASSEGDLVNIALNHLFVGRAYLAHVRLGNASGLPLAYYHVDRAVTGLREAGMQSDLPLGLLARVEYFLCAKEFVRARVDLEEARDISERCSMRLYLTDIHLWLARLCLTERDGQAAIEHLAIARQLVIATGYRRRQFEVDTLLSEANQLV